MARSWPWPDSHTDRLVRIIDSYRTALMEADPLACHHLDARMAEYGQAWIAGETVVDVDRMMSAKEIADEFGLQPWNIVDWARRHPDKIPKHKKGGRTLYRVGDVLDYQRVDW